MFIFLRPQVTNNLYFPINETQNNPTKKRMRLYIRKNAKIRKIQIFGHSAFSASKQPEHHLNYHRIRIVYMQDITILQPYRRRTTEKQVADERSVAGGSAEREKETV